MRERASILETPIIMYDPAPLSCQKGNTEAFFEAAGLADIFSPNNNEIARIFGEVIFPPSKERIEDLALKTVGQGVGREGTGTVIIRAGEHGCLIAKKKMPSLWLPPYYDMANYQAERVFDPTGAGNAFLRACAVG